MQLLKYLVIALTLLFATTEARSTSTYRKNEVWMENEDAYPYSGCRQKPIELLEPSNLDDAPPSSD